MKLLEPGEVVAVDFPGVTGIKRRPVVVISTKEYQSSRSDIVVSVLTSQIPAQLTEFDYILAD